jgi:small conductance mechanosensitive channel
VDLDWSLTQVEDLQRAEELAIEAVEGLELRNPDRPVELFYEKVGDYTIDFKIRFWTEPEQKTFLKARSDAIKAIKLTFEKHGIPMPSPVRVLDFGIVGGVSLREQLEGLGLPLALPEAKPSEKTATVAREEKKTGRPRGSLET